MNFMDGLLLTLLNFVVCITLPKVLSVTTVQGENPARPMSGIQSPESSCEISGVMDAT